MPELGLRERRREKGGENQLLCSNLDVFWDAKKGLKSQKLVVPWGGSDGGKRWWRWWEGRGGNCSLGVCQREREIQAAV